MFKENDVSKNSFLIKYIYPIVLIFFFFLLLPVQLRDDDIVYSAQLNSMKVFDWVWWRAQNWQPRILSDSLLAFFKFYMPLWKIITAILLVLLMIVIEKICNYSMTVEFEMQKKDIYTQSIICGSFLLISPQVLRDAVFWYTGSFHYLWPAFLMMLSFLLFYSVAMGRFIQNKMIIIFCCACSPFVGYMEQTAAISICFESCILLISIFVRKKIPFYCWIQYVLLCANFFLYWIFGGIGPRQTRELHWYKDFNMLSVIDKLFQGVNWTNYHLLNTSNLLVFILSILVFMNISYSTKSKFIQVFSAIPALYLFLSIMPIKWLFSRVDAFNAFGPIGDNYNLSIDKVVLWLLNPMQANPHNFNFDFFNLFPCVISLTVVLYLGILVFLSFNDNLQSIINALIYCAALASGYIIGFSPTIFASQFRVFFMTDLLIVILIGVTFRELFRKIDFCSKKHFCTIIECFVAFSFLCGLSSLIYYI